MNQKQVDILKLLGFSQTYSKGGNNYFSFGIYSVRVNSEENNNLILVTKKRNFKKPARSGEEIILFRGYELFDDKEFAMKLFKKIGFFAYVEFLSKHPNIKERHQIYFNSTEKENEN